jgi:ABC-2 type transport system permease protein
MLPPTWQAITMFNPIVYLVNGFRWSFYGHSDVNVAVSLGMVVVFMVLCVAIITTIFKTGWRLRT